MGTTIGLHRGPALQNGDQAVFRAQRDAGLHRNVLVTLQPQTKPLREHCEDQCRLGHGEGRANAYPRTAAERQVREARALVAQLLGESCRVEALRVLPESAVAM